MAATTEVQQGYGTTVGTQVAVTRMDYLSADVSQATDQRSTYPITVPGAGTDYSFETWNRLNVTAMGGSTQVYLIRTYTTSAAPATGIALVTSANTTTPSNETAATPVDSDSTKATNTYPTADPADDNIYGTLTATGASGWVVSQADVGSTATAGYSQNTYVKYAEIA